MSLRQIQGADVKTAAEVPNPNCLPNDDKFYITAKSINKTLKQAINDQDIGALPDPSIVVNTTNDNYSVSPTPNNTVFVHSLNTFGYYNLPAPSAGLILTFINQQSIPNNGTNIIINASNNTIYWQTNNGGGTDYSATISPGTFTIVALAAAIATAMNTASDGNTYTSTYSSITNTITINRSTGTYTFKMRFGTYTSNSIRRLIGFLAIDSIAFNTSQISESLSLNMRIRPPLGTRLMYRNNLIDNTTTANGYLVISSKGTSVKLFASDTNTWVAQDAICEQPSKNSNLFGIQSQAVSIVGRDTWILNSYSASARWRATAFTLNNYGYLCGGVLTGSIFTNEVDQYNDSTSTWIVKATSGTARMDSAAFSIVGFGYVCNGNLSGGIFTNEVNQYNDSINTWTTVAAGNTARPNLTGFSLNGYGYICNGDLVGSYTNEVDQYNNSTNAWTIMATGGFARGEVAGFSLNGYGYIGAGRAAASQSQVNQYNDSANSWITKAYGKTGDTEGISLNNFGYECNGSSSTVSQYNDFLNIWVTKAPMNPYNDTAGFSLNGYGYICTGYDSGLGNPVSNIYQYN